MRTTISLSALTLVAVACGRAAPNAKSADAPAVETASTADEPAAKRSAPDFSTPEATFATLLQAVRGKDITTYEKCFSSKAIERGEAELEELKAKPEEKWAELQGVFRGPQNIKVDRQDGSARGRVEAPEAEEGGIGGISFVLEDGSWKIQSW